MPEAGALLALDISRRRIGLAVCDPDRIVAAPLLTLENRKWADTLEAIADIVRTRSAVGLVVGYPLNMDGSAGPAAQSRRDKAHSLALAFPELPILLQDERLTTEAVEDGFAQGRWPRPKPRGPIDHYAAAIILEDAMSAIRQSRKDRN